MDDAGEEVDACGFDGVGEVEVVGHEADAGVEVGGELLAAKGDGGGDVLDYHLQGWEGFGDGDPEVA